MRGMLQWKFWRHEGGVAATEFALVLPFLLTLFYGVIEVTRYILIVQKVEKLTYTVADSVSESTTVTKADLDQLFTATADIMSPFSFDTNGIVIVNSLYKSPDLSAATVNWRYSGGGTLTATSKLGNVGAQPNVPSGFTFEDRENVIAVEVYYQFSPLISNQFFGTTTVYRYAYYRPRFGNLTTTPS